METRRRTDVAAGLVLILLGALFMASELLPGWQIYITFSWPLLIIGSGLLMLVIGLVTGVLGIAVPASIISGIGVLLYYQNATGDWESWTYAWALIPGFVGLGVILTGLLGENTRENVRGGAWLVLISLVLFAIFGSLLGGFNWLGPYWPVLLIALGLLSFIETLLRLR